MWDKRVFFKAVFKFTPFLVKFTPFACPILCRLNFKSMFLYQFNYFCGQVLELCPNWPQTPHLCCTYCFKGGGADTLKFNLHVIGHTKKRCEFNQKRCEFKIFLFQCYEIIKVLMKYFIKIKNILLIQFLAPYIEMNL